MPPNAMEATPSQEILDQVRTILRRDLKLGAETALPEDMPFFGGDVDLDSLDMLLLVTSIERQFGVRVPNQAVGKEAFQNVGTLARYVAANQAVKPTEVIVEQSIDWLARLPHGEAFRFVSRVDEVRPGEWAKGAWVVRGDEAFFAGHFPGRPMVPGVLIAEALAQLSGIAGASEGASQGKLAQVDVRFEQTVVPPAEIELEARVTGTLGPLQLCEVSAKVKGVVVARGTIALHRRDGGAA